MKTTVKAIGAFLAVVVIGYLVAAFIQWNPNPGAWPMMAREVAAVTSLTGGAVLGALTVLSGVDA